MNTDVFEARSLKPWLEVMAEWNSFQAPEFRIRESDLRWNQSQQSIVAYRTVLIDGVNCIVANATSDGVKAGLPSKNLWLNLWGAIKEGAEDSFVASLETFATVSGFSKVVVGGDEFHCVPGVPTTAPEGLRLREALNRAGFAGAESADFVGRIASPKVDAYINDAREHARERMMKFTKAESSSAQEELSLFLSKEFPGRWAREFNFWKTRQDTKRASWFTLREHGGVIVGFARLAKRDNLLPLSEGWNPGALRLPLDPTMPNAVYANDGCLGPIGVAVSERGKGTGKLLLGLVLESLRQNKTELVCIDWTNAFKYYEPLSFEIARRYWTAWKSSGQ